MIHLRVPPDRSGLDSFSPKTAAALRRLAVPTSFGLLWPPGVYDFFDSGRFPFGRRIFRTFLAPRFAARSLRNVGKEDIAWILSFCVPLAKTPRLEQALKKRSAKYIFHVMDDWFDFDFLREGTIARCKLADLVGVPTPQLAQRVREFVPEAKIAVFEEPIDVARLDPRQDHISEHPVLLWCGNPYNLRHIGEFLDLLRRIRQQTPFVFRIVCGEKPPKDFSEGLDVEWKRFDHETEGRLIAGSWLGIAPMSDTGHNRCKGAYKVKTYLAAGLPVVASPVGFQADLIRGGEAMGLLPETQTEWEQAITQLLTNRDMCRKMGRKARDYAERRFSHEAVAPQWASTLREHFGSRVSGSHDATAERICQPCAG